MDTPPIMTPEEEAIWDNEGPIDTPTDEVSEETPIEQPDEDSTNEGDVEEVEPEAPETITEEPEEPSEEVESETPEEPAETEPNVLTFKANGMDFNFTEEEMKEKFPEVFGKAMDYTRKMQTIAPWRGFISEADRRGLTQEDLNLFFDLKDGNKEALIQLMKEQEIDPMDLDLDSDKAYTPKQHTEPDNMLDLKEAISKISGDPEYSMTEKVVSESWDDASKQELLSHPDYILGLHGDIKSGIYAEVAPLAVKAKILDGGKKSDLEYYLEAGKSYLDSKQKEVTEAKTSENRQTEIKEKATSRKAAAISKKTNSPKSVIDYLDADNDEDYEKWYKEIMASH